MRNAMPDSMGDNMEDKKRLDPKYLEQLAEEEYRELAGKLVRVGALNGCANGVCSDTFLSDMLGEPVIVRINENAGKGDIHRWMDEWLDPAYSVEIVERGNLPESLCSCWIYGNCRSLDGAFEPGDIYAVVASPKIARIRNTSKCAEKIDIQEIAKRLGAEICDPPERYRHLMGFMRTARGPSEAFEILRQIEAESEAVKKSLKDGLLMPLDAGQKALERTDELLSKYGINEAVEVYDQMAERQAGREAPSKKSSLEEIVDSLRDRISALEAKCIPRQTI